MRMALVALVLVVGAGVVLWFGNTLNSWVLGGLIGGLAALLISIPISVTLFFHLSQRSEERLRVGDEEAVSLAQVHGYGYKDEYRQRYADQVEQVEVYEAESYVLPQGEAWYEEENDRQYHVQRGKSRQRPQPERYLPVPSQPRLPEQSPVRKRRGSGQPVSGKMPALPRTLSSDAEYFPGFPGYQQRSSRGQQQMEARRAAREEASQQNGRAGMTRSPYTRKLPAPRPTSSFQQVDYEEQLPTRALPSQTARQNSSRRIVDSPSGLSSPLADSGVHRSLPPAGETTASRFAQRPASRKHGDPETENLQNRFPRQQTGPIDPHTGQLRQQTGQVGRTGQLRQQPATPQTGQIRRNPNLEGQRRNPDIVTGSLRNPMVRRAPYMYEDDALREELSQMIDPPTVRRSSRYEQQYREYEE